MHSLISRAHSSEQLPCTTVGFKHLPTEPGCLHTSAYETINFSFMELARAPTTSHLRTRQPITC